MEIFGNIKNALEYVDQHLDEAMTYETLAARFHFSPYYFHRMFSLIVGKTIAAYVRDRRLQRACRLLSEGGGTILAVGLACGFDSAPAFSRAFRSAYGLSPREYRAQGLIPQVVTVDELIRRFTNRIQGGVLLSPRIIQKPALRVAGCGGPGSETGRVWQAFESLEGQRPLPQKLSDNGYEIRTYDQDLHQVHVGKSIAPGAAPEGYELYDLPASTYASFDVYVAQGYTSENEAMNEWLATNAQGYRERLLPGGGHYVVEYYDERFNGEEAGSLVEIWIPLAAAGSAR